MKLWVKLIIEKELRFFLGMVGYYCCFVKDFFKIVRFLYEFIFGGKKLIKKKKVKWIFILELWIKECDDVFEILK